MCCDAGGERLSAREGDKSGKNVRVGRAAERKCLKIECSFRKTMTMPADFR